MTLYTSHKYHFKGVLAHGFLQLSFRIKAQSKIVVHLALIVVDNGKVLNLLEFISSFIFANKKKEAFKQKLKSNLQVINNVKTQVIFTMSNFKIAF